MQIPVSLSFAKPLICKNRPQRMINSSRRDVRISSTTVFLVLTTVHSFKNNTCVCVRKPSRNTSRRRARVADSKVLLVLEVSLNKKIWTRRSRKKSIVCFYELTVKLSGWAKFSFLRRDHVQVERIRTGMMHFTISATCLVGNCWFLVSRHSK